MSRSRGGAFLFFNRIHQPHMLTAVSRTNRLRSAMLIVAAAAWLALTQHATLRAAGEEREVVEDSYIEELGVRILTAQPRSSVANELFDKLVFGATGADAVAAARRRLDGLLQEKIGLLERVCDLDESQTHKLRLAGRGDIQRLLDGIDKRREAIRFVQDDGITPEVRQQLVELGMPLRQSLQAGPFDNQSLLAKTLRQSLSGSQLAGYEAVREFELAGGKVTGAPKGPGQSDLVNHVRLPSTGQEDHLLNYLSRIPRLTYLDLEGTQVNDDSLAALDRLTSLQSLVLRRTRVSGSGLAYLAALSELTALDLLDTELTDAALVHLAPFKHLDSLTLGGTRVSDAGMETLARLTSLRRLLLDGTTITDVGLVRIARMTELTELSLAGTAITDVGLARLRTLKNLRRLNLVGTPVSDAGLAELRSLPSLEMVLLVKTRVTVEGVIDLKAKMPGLRVGF